MSLNVRQQRFVEEYLIDLNATQAALRAGYSTKRITSIANRLLKTARVSKAVAEAMARRNERTQITEDYILGNLVMVLERCLQQRPLLNLYGKQLVDENGSHLWTFNAPGATRALELLMKYKGMLTYRVELSGRDGKDLSLAVRLSAARERVHCDDGSCSGPVIGSDVDREEPGLRKITGPGPPHEPARQ